MTAGTYHIQANIQFAPNATGFRLMQITHSVVGGLATAVLPLTGAAVTPALYCATDYPLAVGEYITIQVWQTSGITLNVETVSRASMRWVAL